MTGGSNPSNRPQAAPRLGPHHRGYGSGVTLARIWENPRHTSRLAMLPPHPPRRKGTTMFVVPVGNHYKYCSPGRGGACATRRPVGVHCGGRGAPEARPYTGPASSGRPRARRLRVWVFPPVCRRPWPTTASPRDVRRTPTPAQCAALSNPVVRFPNRSRPRLGTLGRLTGQLGTPSRQPGQNPRQSVQHRCPSVQHRPQVVQHRPPSGQISRTGRSALFALAAESTVPGATSICTWCNRLPAFGQDRPPMVQHRPQSRRNHSHLGQTARAGGAAPSATGRTTVRLHASIARRDGGTTCTHSSARLYGRAHPAEPPNEVGAREAARGCSRYDTARSHRGRTCPAPWTPATGLHTESSRAAGEGSCRPPSGALPARHGPARHRPLGGQDSSQRSE